MKISFDYRDESLARTIYYDRICEQILQHDDYVSEPEQADLIFPSEDTAFETNWPCYARPAAAFVRGSFEIEAHRCYLQRLATTERAMCVINMHPFIRIPQLLAANARMIVADINLRSWERSLNPRTIGMPALPITLGQFDPAAKRLFASFRGVNSHPSRGELMGLHDGVNFVCEIVEPANHFGKLDAERNRVDPIYANMLNESVFAFVPRGDAEFSYRLLEVMSFGCIPIVISMDSFFPSIGPSTGTTRHSISQRKTSLTFPRCWPRSRLHG